MLVTQDLLEGIRTNFRSMFARNFEAAVNLQNWTQLAAEIPSDGEQNTYTWFGTTPKMEDVTGRQLSTQGLNKFSFTIVNKEWQAGIEVERAAIERDRLGLFTPRIQQLSMEAARHPGELLLSLFESPGNAYDGTAFFSDSRVIHDSGTIDNIVTGSGVDTVAKIQTDLAAAKGAMVAFKDDKGRPMLILPNAIVIPGALSGIMWQALNNSAGDGVNTPTPPANWGTGAVLVNGYWVYINPYLTSANDWYVLYTGGGPEEKPFVYQVEKRPELLADTDPNSRAAQERRSYLYSAYGRYNVGVGEPRYAVKINNT